MRALRRILDECSYQRTTHTDFEIRRFMQQPPIDCLLMRARLRYAKRLLCNRLGALCAVLASRPKGKPLPWVSLLLRDLVWLRDFSCVKAFWHLPDPSDNPTLWVD